MLGIELWIRKPGAQKECDNNKNSQWPEWELSQERNLFLPEEIKNKYMEGYKQVLIVAITIIRNHIPSFLLSKLFLCVCLSNHITSPGPQLCTNNIMPLWRKTQQQYSNSNQPTRHFQIAHVNRFHKTLRLVWNCCTTCFLHCWHDLPRKRTKSCCSWISVTSKNGAKKHSFKIRLRIRSHAINQQ